MRDAKAAELLLIDCRPDSPLVRTRREWRGLPVGTLGYIEGVEACYVKVRLAGSEESVPMLPGEVESV